MTAPAIVPAPPDMTGQVGIVPAPRYPWSANWSGWAAWGVAAVTSSDTGHVVVDVGRGMVASAEPGGVRLRPRGAYTGVLWSKFRLPGYAAGRAAAWARAQATARVPYAYADDLLILCERALGVKFPNFVRDGFADTGQLQCAQLATGALIAAGVDPFPGSDRLGDVSPADYEWLFIRAGWYTPADFKQRRYS